AEAPTAEALEIRMEKFGEDNIGVAASLNNYGVLHYNVGRYNESEKSLTKARSIIAANKMTATMQHAIVLNNQAMLFQTIGRYDEAEALLKEAIAIVDRLPGSKSKNNLRFQSNLALLYQ